ncbi:hypothetical protein [Thiothrix winogradskyi]|uniref:Type II toxin-antitoxin system HicB family antitoxin n=1 Tax=Thiothrix winogradskyi TaxID=96472 RepID=A0ABY3T315_9GAMM|nr:hypothetical protein [Thiothrix winogradskyi]UJS26241.1 hypothetical protein L2Y54_09440 [Thiothrix winogradskyi]
MIQQYNALIQTDGEWWYGWVEEIPGVNAQEKSEAALLASLREVLVEAIEMNRADARSAAKAGYREVSLAA